MQRMLKTVLVGSLGLLIFLAGPAIAQEQLAIVENFGDALVFQPVTEFAKLILTVTGPCDLQYRQEVTAGDLIFRLDPTTIDGNYTYDLVRIDPIDPAVVEILQQARKKADEETPRQLCRDGKLPPPPTSQSEGFTVSFGRIIYDPAAIEKGAGVRSVRSSSVSQGPRSAASSSEGGLTPITAPDFVIIDDLIVDGSACIGFDCVNGESFGFDTIRLKENNLRIKFDDTSTAASFPRNDWQLTANDSANGGASKFSIDDISGGRTPFTVEANARSHSLYVDDGGRIGSRTSTPSTEIHTIDGDTPALRLQQDGSSGFAPQTWDIAGNETNFFIRDVTNGSTLPFRIRPGAPSSAIMIDDAGNVGLGTASPSTALHVNRTSGAADVLVQAGVGNASLTFDGAASSDLILDRGNTSSNSRMQLKTAGTLKWSIGMANNATDNLHIGPSTGTTFVFVNQSTGDVGIGTTSPGGKLDVNGSIFQRGGLLHADYVFAPDYSLESIEEHAEFMWANRHLPAMPRAKTDENGLEVVELGAHRRGIVEELEKAHIFIEQLNQQLTEKSDQLSRIEEQNAQLVSELESLKDLVHQLAQER